MNKQKLAHSLHYRVRLWPVAWRKVPGGPWLPPIDDDWVVMDVREQGGVVRLDNPRTGHFVLLGHDRIHHFDHEPQRDWDGLKHGMFVLRTQLVLSGNNVFYLPREGNPSH